MRVGASISRVGAGCRSAPTESAESCMGAGDRNCKPLAVYRCPTDGDGDPLRGEIHQRRRRDNNWKSPRWKITSRRLSQESDKFTGPVKENTGTTSLSPCAFRAIQLTAAAPTKEVEGWTRRTHAHTTRDEFPRRSERVGR